MAQESSDWYFEDIQALTCIEDMEKISEIRIVCQAIALSGQKSNGAMDV